MRHLSQWAEATFKVPRDDFIRLEHAVERLAEAQNRTEQRLDGLTEKVQELNEGTFRATIQGVFQKMDGITVKSGYYGDREIDVIIRGGEHILL